MVTETVRVPAPVAEKVPAYWPAPSVGLEGCTRLSPDPPVTCRIAEAPLMRFPKASLAVTVIVVELAPELAVILPVDTAMVDRDGLTAPKRST